MRFFEIKNRAALRRPDDWNNVVKIILNIIAGRSRSGPAAFRAGLKLALVLALGLLAGLAGAQPANDNFASASLLSVYAGTTNGNNISATLESPCETNQVNCDDDGLQTVSNSVWYAWTAPATGPAEFNTIGSGFDTV